MFWKEAVLSFMTFLRLKLFDWPMFIILKRKPYITLS